MAVSVYSTKDENIHWILSNYPLCYSVIHETRSSKDEFSTDVQCFILNHGIFRNPTWSRHPDIESFTARLAKISPCLFCTSPLYSLSVALLCLSGQQPASALPLQKEIWQKYCQHCYCNYILCSAFCKSACSVLCSAFYMVTWCLEIGLLIRETRSKALDAIKKGTLATK